MAELYPVTYYEQPVPPEAGLWRDTMLRLGLCAIRSEAAVVATIHGTDDDVELLLNNLQHGLYIPSHVALSAHLTRLPEADALTAGRLIDTFDSVLDREAQTHGLERRGDQIGIQFSIGRSELPLSEDIHIDAASPYHERTKLGRLIRPGYDGQGTIGAVRYVASFGPEAREGGTQLVDGPVSRAEWLDKASLVPRLRSYPAGTVVRFTAEAGVHQRSPHIRPRAFVTDSLWRRKSQR